MELKNSNGITLFTKDDGSALRDGVGYELWKAFDKGNPSCIHRFERESKFFECSEGIPCIPASYLIDRDSFKIVRPFIRGDSLNAYKNKMEIQPTIDILLDWAKSLRAMHQKGMVYCDVKPANAILRDDGKGITLIDFDGVEFIASGKDSVSGMCRGTFPYFAPERLMGAQSFTTPSSDTFGLGILAYYLLKGASSPYKSGFLPESSKPGEMKDWERAITREISNKDAKPLRSHCSDLDSLVKGCVSRGHLDRVKDDELVSSLTLLKDKYSK